MSLHPKLAGPLQDRMKEYCRKGEKLWAEASKIVTELGTKESRISSDHTTTTYELTFRHGPSVCKIMKSNYVMGGDYIIVNVDHKVVLHVGERDGIGTSVTDKPRTVRIQDQHYLVEAYIPGPWEEWLEDFDKIKTGLEEVKKADAKEASRALAARRKADEEKRSFSEEEEKIARSFGFPTF